MIERRRFLRGLAAAGGSVVLGPLASLAQSNPVLTRAIPKSGEAIPLVGLGSWITFNVGRDLAARNNCTAVMQGFFEAGGRLIDSSPMYGSSQEVIGHGLKALGMPAATFSADKVWTGNSGRGPDQIENSRRAWGVSRFDLLQVHNLVAWEDHLPLLRRMKTDGRLRYLGITTSEGRRHDEFERIMRSEPLDFIQVSYNIVDREVETRILPLARDRGIAVLINRPFQQGALTRRLQRYPLPPWAPELGCTSWAQIILKFIVSHPAVTCAIPATTSVAHVRENLAAARGRLPEEAMRRRMVAHVEAL